MDGGTLVARVLEARGVRFLFTLCGGHISPILVGCKCAGIRVVDVRHEVTAVFAADAVSRLSGLPGVAVVTAGPGVANTVTAVKNARIAQSPLVVLGGATATLLRGRGALQDIDQLALMRPHVKWATRVRRGRDIEVTLHRAFDLSMDGVRGPVFVELPVDVLYPQATVRTFYELDRKRGGASLRSRVVAWYFERHLARIAVPATASAADTSSLVDSTGLPPEAAVSSRKVGAVSALLGTSRRPLLLLGTQVTSSSAALDEVVQAIEMLGVPAYASGMARGILPGQHRLAVRHQRRRALREADLVILAGVPCDFRLGYGRQIPSRTPVVAINRMAADIHHNRRARVGVHGDPADYLRSLAEVASPDGSVATEREEWIRTLADRDREREAAIDEMASSPAPPVNPVRLCRLVDGMMGDDSVIVADGGDFVGTASYVVRPRRPLSWLDPGPFGTLGVGAGFALGAGLCRPEAEVWILYGDGSAAYSLMEFDTFVRHGIAVIAVIGNDACWTQIARSQIAVYEDDVATMLGRTDYHAVADALGARGFLLDDPDRAGEVLRQARETALGGTPVIVNAHIGSTDFRKDSISL